MTTKMAKAQRAAILTAHETRSPIVTSSVARRRTICRNGWSLAVSDGANVSRAGLIAAGVDMDALHAEALYEHAGHANFGS